MRYFRTHHIARKLRSGIKSEEHARRKNRMMDLLRLVRSNAPQSIVRDGFKTALLDDFPQDAKSASRSA